MNPNWEAIRDVKKFRFGTDHLHKGKQRLDAEGCMYYINPRCVAPPPAGKRLTP